MASPSSSSSSPSTTTSPTSSAPSTIPSTREKLPLSSSRPASEALLNEKWDHCLSTALIRSTLGASFGVIFAVLIFRRRPWPVFVGAGFGAGRAWEECDAAFRRRN
ncbi:MAG: Mitochondrial inner membrane organizing system component [Caeruleum heppii]|nr:MAG: Mitochondrial inner membrane organizing system component [Caeruleum heppii]